jgi:hypothetical protein
VFHFSEDPTIEEFVPHVAATSALATPLVWAVDAEHQASYWFPRDCPRVTYWGDGHPLLCGARRVHAVEWAWLGRLRDTVLYRYVFDQGPFRCQDACAGYHVAERVVRPLRVEPVGDLLAAHADAGIELRLVADLWPLADAVCGSGLEFSLIRMHNAAPRS